MQRDRPTRPTHHDMTRPTCGRPRCSRPPTLAVSYRFDHGPITSEAMCGAHRQEAERIPEVAVLRADRIPTDPRERDHS